MSLRRPPFCLIIWPRKLLQESGSSSKDLVEMIETSGKITKFPNEIMEFVNFFGRYVENFFKVFISEKECILIKIHSFSDKKNF